MCLYIKQFRKCIMKEVFVEKRQNLLRIAVKKEGKLEECLVEEHSDEPQIGEVYKGRVKNIIPGINSVFVDIGLNREAYMYYSEELKRIGLKKGQEILVEVLKEPIGNKGAKVSNKISILGRYMVITLGDEGISVSKRITNIEDRQRLINFINPINGLGLVFRTESIEASEEELQEELATLLSKRDTLEKKLNYSTKLGKIQSNNLVFRYFQELSNCNTKIIVDDLEYMNIIKELLEGKEEYIFQYYDGNRSLFDYYGIEKEIIKLRHKKVNLPCGGYIVIDKTEAMYTIDVNSGKNIKAKDFNKTILQTNLEAAKEIGRQIKLRNLSGIIIADFIDMRDEKQKKL